MDLDPKDLRIDTYRGSGAGGQHRNKTDSCVRITHIPTGMVACGESNRSQALNKEDALAVLQAKLTYVKEQANRKERDATRKEHVGVGARGDKVRSIRYQDGIVTCERTGKKHRLKDYLKGDLSWL